MQSCPFKIVKASPLQFTHVFGSPCMAIYYEKCRIYPTRLDFLTFSLSIIHSQSCNISDENDTMTFDLFFFFFLDYKQDLRSLCSITCIMDVCTIWSCKIFN